MRIPGVQLEGRLGEGSTGEVYRAVRAGRSVAVKILYAERERHRHWREVTSLARSRHRGIPEVLDTGLVDGRMYMVMELVEGRPLSDSGPLAPETVHRMARSLAQILAVVHGRGLIHRDISPANVLVDAEGEVHLVDFGFAEASHRVGAVGTPHYAAPEQTGMLRGVPVDARADLYALGAVLYRALTGRPPYDADDPGEVVRLHATAPIPDPSDDAADASPHLIHTIRCLLAKDPEDRPRSAADVLASLSGRPQRRLEAPRVCVGRREETDLLRTAWARAAVGHGSIWCVRGASGMGKSTLARQVAGTTEGALWHGRCNPGAQRPLGVVLSALHDWQAMEPEWPQLLGSLPDDVRRTLTHVGLHTELAPLPTPPTPDQLRAAVAEAILCASGHAPVLWIVDDIQWLDEDSAAVLALLAADVHERSTMVLCTARSESEHADRLERLLPRIDATVVELAALQRDGVVSLLREELGAEPPDDLADRVLAAGGGRPIVASTYTSMRCWTEARSDRVRRGGSSTTPPSSASRCPAASNSSCYGASTDSDPRR